MKQAVPFLNGLLSSLHLKCKQARFYRSLEEAKEYVSKASFLELIQHIFLILYCEVLSTVFRFHFILYRFLCTQLLPENMLQLQKSMEKGSSDANSNKDVHSCDNLSEDKTAESGGDYDEMTPIELGNLRVSKLGMF